MTELNLYKFITETNCEYHNYDNNGTPDIILFVNMHFIERFNKLLGSGILDEGGIECVMKDGYICFRMKDICEYFDIEMKNVFLDNN